MTIVHYPGRRAAAPVAPSCQRAALLFLLLLLGACAHQGSGGRTGAAPGGIDSVAANGVLIRAIGLVGTPYRYGGASPEGGFDCSGLVQFVFRDSAGIRLPRSTRELVAMPAGEVDRDELEPGDLVFFNPGGGPPSHIGIYVGEGRFVHAPSSGGTVRLDLLESDYWRKAWSGGRRILR